MDLRPPRRNWLPLFVGQTSSSQNWTPDSGPDQRGSHTVTPSNSSQVNRGEVPSRVLTTISAAWHSVFQQEQSLLTFPLWNKSFWCLADDSLWFFWILFRFRIFFVKKIITNLWFCFILFRSKITVQPLVLKVLISSSEKYLLWKFEIQEGYFSPYEGKHSPTHAKILFCVIIAAINNYFKSKNNGWKVIFILYVYTKFWTIYLQDRKTSKFFYNQMLEKYDLHWQTNRLTKRLVQFFYNLKLV